MLGEGILPSLGFIVVAGAVFAALARRIRMPAIVAYLLAGLVLGPATGLVRITPALELISEVGIALLLFLVGLELSFHKVRDVGPVAVVAGLGQVVFTALGGLALCWLMGFTWTESLFLAVALTFSSTVVVVKLLDEKQELNSLYGRIAVGIFLVQDLVAILILTFLAGLSADTERSLVSMAVGLGQAFGGMLLLLGVVLVAAKWLLPRPLAWAARAPETIFIWSLTWCFVMVLLAHQAHLSLEIGAFLAGISLAQLPYSEDLRRRVHPLMNFCIAVFFVSLGIKLELGAVQAHWGAALWLALFVLLGNPLIFMLIIARMGYGERTSFFTSVTVAQISEFSFIVVALGVSTGLVGAEILSITALVGLVTIALSAYMILYNQQLYEVCRRLKLLRPFRAECGLEEAPAPPRRRHHVIIVGMNTLGRELTRRLTAAGEIVLAIDTDSGKLRELPCATLLGNVEYLSVLEEAGLPHARLLISALQIEATNDLLAYRCRAHRVPCAVHVIDLEETDNLLEMDVAYLMIPKVDGVKLQTRELKRLGFLGL
jgi:Kef-type K+ transport system membrane component KefB